MRAVANSGSAEHLPESPVIRSSSGETLNLTVMSGNRAAGDVETSHPEVGDSIRLPGTSSPIRDVSTVEGSQVPVWEPVRMPDAPHRDIVSQGDGAAQDISIGSDQNPTVDHGSPRDPTFIKQRHPLADVENLTNNPPFLGNSAR